MKNPRLILVGSIALLILVIYCAYASDLPKWFPFKQQSSLEEWQEKIFKGKVLYEIKAEHSKENFLSASSNKACSGLLYRIKFDVKEFPMFSWEWKVSQFPAKKIVTDESTGWMERDDYAARVYVIFSSWNFMNIKSLEYIWDESVPVGTVKTSPYMDNIKMIVTESGAGNLNKWAKEERNIFEDYKKVFGANPPRYVGAIAIMTDSDNTLSTAEAAYQNLKVGYKQ